MPPTPDSKIRVVVHGINSRADSERVTLKPVPSATASIVGFVQIELKGAARGSLKTGETYIMSFDQRPTGNEPVDPAPSVEPVAEVVPPAPVEDIPPVADPTDPPTEPEPTKSHKHGKKH